MKTLREMMAMTAKAKYEQELQVVRDWLDSDEWNQWVNAPVSESNRTLTDVEERAIRFLRDGVV